MPGSGPPSWRTRVPAGMFRLIPPTQESRISRNWHYTQKLRAARLRRRGSPASKRNEWAVAGSGHKCAQAGPCGNARRLNGVRPRSRPIASRKISRRLQLRGEMGAARNDLQARVRQAGGQFRADIGAVFALVMSRPAQSHGNPHLPRAAAADRVRPARRKAARKYFRIACAKKTRALAAGRAQIGMMRPWKFRCEQARRPRRIRDRRQTPWPLGRPPPFVRKACRSSASGKLPAPQIRARATSFGRE